MKLTDLINKKDYSTDKNTTHSYLEFYDSIFSDLRDMELNILEIGTGCGGATELWSDYFHKSKIYGIEINAHSNLERLNQKENIEVYQNTNACLTQTISMFEEIDKKFDIIIDDASHSLSSQMFTCREWTRFLNTNGILVIEDIANISYSHQIIESLPEDMRKSAKVEDRRSIKNRYDDILITAIKEN